MLQKIDILAISVIAISFYITILKIQQNYFSNPAKILDLLAKPFFPCTNTCT